jgi:uncharacterized membrane protein YfcA
MMLEVLLITAVAFSASLLTFFSGFGLGTMLLPVFALFFPISAALMMTAVVHLLNNIFKLGLIGSHVSLPVVLRFGLPALVFAWLGSGLLIRASAMAPVAEYDWLGGHHQVTLAGLLIGGLMLVFAITELLGGEKRGFAPRWLPLGGALSGFFGGLSGHQGALRSAFLLRCNLSKEAYIATGVSIACLVDLARLSQYLPAWRELLGELPVNLLLVAIGAAFSGALLGRILLKKVSLQSVHRLVGLLLLMAGAAVAGGLI